MYRALSSKERRTIILNHLTEQDLSLQDISRKFYEENGEVFFTLSIEQQKGLYFNRSDCDVYTHFNKESKWLKDKGFVVEAGTQVGRKGVKEAILHITSEGRQALINHNL